MPVSATIRSLFSKARLLDTGNPKVVLSESEVYALLLLICRDLGWSPARIGLPVPQHAVPDANYYRLDPGWFTSLVGTPNASQLQEALAAGIEVERDVEMYFVNLCSLHKRRLKYRRILNTQPKPTMDQVGSRSLLEYGTYDSEFLFNWLVWRKWLFDLDNRSGQETGYLFEPVLTSSLGGVPVGAKDSPVKRIGVDGLPQTGGRQIDCYIGDENAAYEFKIRLTIAASGQGRWSEELSFPKECRAAGIKPVLIVLDPTSSNRMVELRSVFLAEGGEVYVGDAAWAHIKERAGHTMARFVENYIKPPLDAASEFETTQLAPMSLTWALNEVVIRLGEREYRIPRD